MSIRMGTFETGTQDAQEYAKAYGRGYKGKQGESYEETLKDTLANSYRLKAAQEQTKAQHIASVYDYLKTIEGNKIKGQYDVQAEAMQGQYGVQAEVAKGQYGLAREDLSGQYSLRGKNMEGMFGLQKQDMSDKAAMQRSILDNEFDNVRKQWEIESSEHQNLVKEQGMHRRLILGKELEGILQQRQDDRALKNTLVGKRYDRETEYYKSLLRNKEEALKVGRELYDDPETQQYYASFNDLMARGEVETASKYLAAIKAMGPNRRQAKDADDANKATLDFRLRYQQLQNQDREFYGVDSEGNQGLKAREMVQKNLQDSQENYINLSELAEKMDKDFQTQLTSNPKLAPAANYIVAAQQAMQVIQDPRQSPEARQQAQEQLTTYMQGIPVEAHAWFMNRTKVEMLKANSEAQLNAVLGRDAVEFSPEQLTRIMQGDPRAQDSKVMGAIKFAGELLASPITMLVNPLIRTVTAVEEENSPEQVRNNAQLIMRYNLRKHEGYTSTMLDEELAHRLDGMSEQDMKSYIAKNMSIIRQAQEVIQGGPAKGYERNPSDSMNERSKALFGEAAELAAGLLMGKVIGAVGGKAAQFVKGKISARNAKYFAQREAQLAAQNQNGLYPIEGGTPFEPGVPSPANVSYNALGKMINPPVNPRDAAFNALDTTIQPIVTRGGVITNQPQFQGPVPGLQTVNPYVPTRPLQQAPATNLVGPQPPVKFGPALPPAGSMQPPNLRGATGPLFSPVSGGVATPEQIVRDVATKIQSGQLASTQDVKAVLSIIKTHPEAFKSMPEIQATAGAFLKNGQAASVAEAEDMAVAQWTTKMLANKMSKRLTGLGKKKPQPANTLMPTLAPPIERRR